MLEQYWALKREVPDAILLYRLGDFYEMFFEDAETAAPLLGLVLTARHRDTDIEAPMCGVPHHALESYVARLVAAGKKVAIAEQTEAPQKGKTLVARKIVRVITPGTLVDPERLDARQANDLAAIVLGADAPALAYLDLSTGDFSVDPPRRDPARRDALPARPAKELVAFPSEREAVARLLESLGSEAPVLSVLPSESPRGRSAAELLEGHFRTSTLAGFGLPAAGPARRRRRGRPRLRPLDAEGRLRPRDDPQDRVGRRGPRRRRRDAGAPRALPLASRRRAGRERSSPSSTGRGRRSARGRSGGSSSSRSARSRRSRSASTPWRSSSRPRRASRPLGDGPRERSPTCRGSSRASRSGARRRATSPPSASGLARAAALGAAPRRLRVARSSRRAAGRSPTGVPVALAARLAATLVETPPVSSKEGGLVRDGADAAVDELRALRRDAATLLGALEADGARPGAGSRRSA